MQIQPKEGETLNPFIRGKLKVIQSKEGYRFNLDSVLLASFVDIPDKDLSVIDLGTGNGIILLLLSLKYKNANFFAVEVQESLFSQAWRNFHLNNVKVQLFKGDITEIRRIFKPSSFDVVIFNPPYHPPPKDYTNDEKSIARYEILAGLKDFIKASSFLLKPKGKLFFIYPAENLSKAVFLLKERQIVPKEYRFVYPSIEEKASHVLIKAVKDANEGGEIVQKPLIVYENPKEKKYSKEVEYLLEKFCEEKDGK